MQIRPIEQSQFVLKAVYKISITEELDWINKKKALRALRMNEMKIKWVIYIN